MKMLRSIGLATIGIALLALSNIAVAAMPADAGVHMVQPMASQEYPSPMLRTFASAEAPQCERQPAPAMVAVKSVPASVSIMRAMPASGDASHMTPFRLRC